MLSLSPSMYSAPTSPCDCDQDDCIRALHKFGPPSSPLLAPQKAPLEPPPVRRKKRDPISLLKRAANKLGRTLFPIQPPVFWPMSVCTGPLLSHDMSHMFTNLEVNTKDMLNAWMHIASEIKSVPFRAHIYVKDISKSTSALCYESNNAIGVLPFEDDYVFDIIDARGMFALKDGSIVIVTTQMTNVHGLTNDCPVCRIVGPDDIESMQIFLEHGMSLMVDASAKVSGKGPLARVRQWTSRAMAQIYRRRIYFESDTGDEKH